MVAFFHIFFPNSGGESECGWYGPSFCQTPPQKKQLKVEKEKSTGMLLWKYTGSPVSEFPYHLYALV